MQFRPVCPRCGPNDVHRSRPAWWLEAVLVRFTRLRFWRCHTCMKRICVVEPRSVSA